MISISDFLSLPPDTRRQLLKYLQNAHKSQSISIVKKSNQIFAVLFVIQKSLATMVAVL